MMQPAAKRKLITLTNTTHPRLLLPFILQKRQFSYFYPFIVIFIKDRLSLFLFLPKSVLLVSESLLTLEILFVKRPFLNKTFIMYWFLLTNQNPEINKGMI